MRKMKFLRTALLTFIFTITNLCAVSAEATDVLPQELSMERLLAIIKRFGPPPVKLIISIIVLLALILAAVLWYKKIAAEEDKNEQRKKD